MFCYDIGMTEKNSILNNLNDLRLPKGGYIVMGSGILDALNIRRASDIDLVVNDEIYNHLQQLGWGERMASNGSIGIEKGVFQAYDHWNDEGVVKTLGELIVDAEWINGVPYNSLAKLSLYKMRRGLHKDLVDLELINQYLAPKK